MVPDLANIAKNQFSKKCANLFGNIFYAKISQKLP